MRANGGALTLESLARYQALDARVVRGSYRGYELVGLDVPAAGVLCIQALQIMENFDPSQMTDAQWAAVTGQALGIASRELDALGTDTAAARATSKNWARNMSDRVNAPGHQPSDGVHTPLPATPRQDEEGHTTHLTTADGNGMFVALTQTLGPTMGSSVVTPGLGFLYASTLGGYLGRIEPGERARSNISPFMVLKDGQPILMLGGAGGARIPSGVVQVISRIIDDHLSLVEALAAPRVHMSGGTLDAETTPGIGWKPEDLRLMRSLGLEVTENPREGAFSRIHAIQYDPQNRTWTGAADPDWEGSAQAPRPTPVRR
jgi:gamma-glutamyltranspeptidase/glutathione hydrolase